MVLVAVIANTAARGYRPRFVFYTPEPDTTGNSDSLTKNDSARKLRFPIYDRTGDPVIDAQNPRSIDLNDPKNEQRSFDYDPKSNSYNYSDKLGNDFMRNPTYLTLDEYGKYRGKQEEDAYWQRRMDGLMLFNKKPELPQMYKEGLFDRIFGGNSIQVKPQGNVDVTFGGNWQNIKNPTLPQRAQKYGIFDFDMQMNINLLATVGDKLKLNISNNTKATFDYQNIQKLDYNGKEDEMLKKIEAGNVSFPLRSNLINGVQSLFGLKTQLQFGKLWVTAVLSQQKSQRKSLTIQGGAQSQQIAIKASGYEDNKNFLLSHFFRDNYNYALKDFPKLRSNVNISKIQVWITNRNGVVNGVRNVECFMDLGEAQPYNKSLYNPNTTVRNGLPDNQSNFLYRQLVQNQFSRLQSSAINTLVTTLGLVQGQDFEATTARQLSPSEFSFHPQLGYIMLNTQMNPEDVLGVAFRYTYNGKVYQVGEFAEDLPPDTSNSKVIFLKLLKGTSARPTLPVWDLMMKNVYALGGLGVSKENFVLNILYQQPAGGDLRYIPDGPSKGIPLLTLLNLDRLNAQNDRVPDGIFDFVEGTTINTQQGKIIFPVLEPFGSDLSATAFGAQPDPRLYKKYVYQVLYDSTKVVAQQSQQIDRYILRGSYKSSSSSDIFLGGFNIPPGSVSVSAGGTRLVENQDYTMDYSLGRIKILNTGILNSGVPINIQYEDNATFGFQQQNFMGSRVDYYVNKKLNIGGTFMRLNERPFTQQVSYGEDPIKNTVLGLDANYQSEMPALSRALDKLPVYSTTAPSFLNSNVEVAALLPGQPKQIAALDPEGSVYIDNFEGTSSSYDLKFPSQAWSLAATPFGAIGVNNQKLFPESALHNDLKAGVNRGRFAWYSIEPTLLQDNGGGVPAYVTKEPLQHFIRLIQQKDVFPNKQVVSIQSMLATFDIGFYPKDRGPYNFDADNVDNDGKLLNPTVRWGGITRPIDNTDFEASNVEYIQFWVMDPLVHDKSPNAKGGSLFFNLGNISEDVAKDSRMFFENGIPAPFDASKMDTTAFGYVPKFAQQITRAFDNDPTSRTLQDVGYDGLPDSAMTPDQYDERTYFANYLLKLRQKIGAGSPAFMDAYSDPSTDNYHFFRGTDYDQMNNGEGLGILGRYKKYNSPQGNSPITAANATFATSSTTIPESEDVNRDNTLNQSESYFQYRIDFTPNMQVGTNYIVSIQDNPSGVKLPNGKTEPERWYQFKIPVREFTHRIGGISDFRSIRFMRMFLSGWEDSTILRFATLELGRNQWRTYIYNLDNPDENIPQQQGQGLTDFTVTSVNIEENGRRDPVNYVLPPGVNRQVTNVQGQQRPLQMNEQSISLRACALMEGTRRAVYKEVNVDMRQFTYLRTFIHAESMVGSPAIRDADVSAFIRIGSDFTQNYYEYVVPVAVTPPGNNQDVQVWPAANQVNLLLQDLVNAKKERDAKGLPNSQPYTTKDSKGNTIVVLGNPNIGAAKNIMLGLYNPKKSPQTPGDDGLPKCAEVWFDELRMAGIYDRAGYAAAGKVSVQLADLGNVNLSGSMHTPGYGNIDQKINQRLQDNYYQYNTSTNLNLGKVMPKNWGVQLPFFAGYTQNVSTPKYDPYNEDVLLGDQLSGAKNAQARDSIRKVAQDFTSIKSFNFTNVRIQGNPAAPATKVRKPWSVKNFDFSYSYNDQVKRNPTIEKDQMKTQKYGLGYTYAIKTKPIEPFRRMIKSRSKWLSLVKDVNLTPLPSTFTMRNDLNRITEETKVRDFNDGSGYRIPPTFYKNFTWNRAYTLRWELMRSLSLDYAATNISRIDEPYGRVNTKEKKDSLWRQIGTFGKNTYYNQTFNSTYNVPLAKLPVTDWMNCRLGYSANYTWTTAPPVAYELGNTIGNTNTKTITGELNMTQLYNKSRWLRALNSPRTKKKQAGPGQPQGSSVMQGSGDTKKNVKDLRKPGSRKDIVEEKKADESGLLNPSGKKGGKSDSAKADSSVKKKEPPDKKKEPEKIDPIKEKYGDLLQNVNTANMTDKQIDSVVKSLKAKEHAKKVAEKAKKKKERKAARKLRRSKVPELSTTQEVIGHVLTMVNRVTVNYSQTAGTTLPGYMDSTRFLGVNNYSGAPGFNFVYGYQPDGAWLARQADANRLSRDTFFNAQFQQNYSRNLNAQATLLPHKDFRVDLTLTQTFSKSHSELYADTSYHPDSSFHHLNPYEGGAFNISYVAIKTMFKNTEVGSATYNQFLSNRTVISRRLGTSNPYTNGVPDPSNPGYYKGYGPFSQDVLIPSFIAAYSGKSPENAALIDYKHTKVSDNPFKYYTPLPNWKVTYNGLSKLPLFKEMFTNFIVSHAYTSTMSMNAFNSNLLFNDLYGLGFPSFLDSNSNNYVPFFQVPNVTISQALNPLIGFDMAFKNNVSARFDIRKSKMQSLSLIDYQISENASTEYVFGLGFRKRGIKLPFTVLGVKRLKNELICKLDIGLRDDKSSNTFLANNINVVSRGQKVIRISPTIDYSVNQKLTLHFYYDRQQTIPYVSNSYPTTTTRAGVTLRFLFAQ